MTLTLTLTRTLIQTQTLSRTLTLTQEWAARVRARVLAGVPGAGVLDVEPMDPEDGGREPAVALAAFALVGGVVSLGLEPKP